MTKKELIEENERLKEKIIVYQNELDDTKAINNELEDQNGDLQYEIELNEATMKVQREVIMLFKVGQTQ